MAATANVNAMIAVALHEFNRDIDHLAKTRCYDPVVRIKAFGYSSHDSLIDCAVELEKWN